MNNKIFVYGTLMTEGSNHDIIPKESIEYIEPATVENVDLYMYRSSNFPAMIRGKRNVVGELITIKEEYINQVIKLTDILEGYISENNLDNFYHRIQGPCKLQDGSEIISNMYLYNESNGGLTELIQDGDFRTFIQK